jgi:hypothetical protein
MKDNNFQKILFPISALISLIALIFFTGPVITYDGQQYLSSARAIIDGRWDDFFFFGRPPGYSAFLAMCHFLSGGSMKFVVIIQFLLILISTVYVRHKVFKLLQNQRIEIEVLFCFYILASGIFGYSNTVLQQPILIAISNLIFGLLIEFFSRTNNRLYWIKLFVISVISPLFSPILSLLMFACFISIVLFEVIKRREVYKIKASISGVLASLIVLILVQFQWSQVENSFFDANPEIRYVATPGGKDVPQFLVNVKTDPIRTLDQILKSYLGQSGLVASNGWSGAAENMHPDLWENRVHAEYAFLAERNYGLVDTVGYKDYVQYGMSIWEIKPAYVKSNNLIFAFFSFPTQVIRFFFLFFPGIILTYLVTFRKTGITPISIWMIAPNLILVLAYMILGAQADRYMLPNILPLAVFSLALVSSIRRSLRGSA